MNHPASTARHDRARAGAVPPARIEAAVAPDLAPLAVVDLVERPAAVAVQGLVLRLRDQVANRQGSGPKFLRVDSQTGCRESHVQKRPQTNDVALRSTGPCHELRDEGQDLGHVPQVCVIQGAGDGGKVLPAEVLHPGSGVGRHSRQKGCRSAVLVVGRQAAERPAEVRDRLRREALQVRARLRRGGRQEAPDGAAAGELEPHNRPGNVREALGAELPHAVKRLLRGGEHHVRDLGGGRDSTVGLPANDSGNRPDGDGQLLRPEERQPPRRKLAGDGTAEG
mmetsp:Transcript_31698/g.90962  ORF Transcript_31698/g.90962 Transcript_31698/m.90962 type:complete len:281 (+) Transcript_31698:430-1272(+)